MSFVQPNKKPKGRELTDEEKENNRKIASIRIRIEHVICGIKSTASSKINSEIGRKGLVMQ